MNESINQSINLEIEIEIEIEINQSINRTRVSRPVHPLYITTGSLAESQSSSSTQKPIKSERREEENSYLVVALYNHILLDLLKPSLEGVRLGRCELLTDLDASQLLPVTACDLGSSGGSPGIIVVRGEAASSSSSSPTRHTLLVKR
jgi:hypothetical protein